MRLEWSQWAIVCVFSVSALATGCGQQHGVAAPSPDAGSEDSGVPAEEPGEQTVELAPSGAEIEPATTVMSSGQFQLVGSLSVESGATSASQSYELRSGSLELRQR
jgi:hypothetical protein